MVEIYSSKDKNHDEESGESESTKQKRLSVSEIRKIIGREGREGIFTSFVTFPDQIKLKAQEPGEEVVMFLRQHPIVNLGWFLVSLVLSFIPSLFQFFPFYLDLPSDYQALIVFLWYLMLFGYVVANMMNWFFNVFIVTDERLIDADFENLFTRVISETKIERVQDLHSSMSGAFKLIFNYGNVAVQTASEIPEFVFQNVPHPDLVAKYISQLIDLEEQEKLEGRVK